MGRSPCCSDQEGIKKGPWSPEEDKLLVEYVNENGPGNWQTLPKKAGLNRCGKSCRLRWTNYLRPDIKRGPFSKEEEAIIISLHQESGNKWSKIAAYLPGRTDNEIKNYWNTHLRKKLLRSGVDPKTHKQISDLDCLYQFLSNSNLSNLSTPLSFQGNPSFQFLQRLQNLQQVINLSSLPYLQAASQLNLNGLQINGVNTEFTAGNFFQPQTILPELSNFIPLLNELYATSNSFLPGGHGISTFSATNLDSAHVSPAESDSFSEEALAHDTSNMAPQAGILSPSNSLQGYIPTQAFESDILDNLDNFLDDEASSSFLKDILG